MIQYSGCQQLSVKGICAQAENLRGQRRRRNRKGMVAKSRWLIGERAARRAVEDLWNRRLIHPPACACQELCLNNAFYSLNKTMLAVENANRQRRKRPYPSLGLFHSYFFRILSNTKCDGA